jgi:hypothetical protein
MKLPPTGPSETPVLVSYWFARWPCESTAVSFSPMVSQWELRPALPFPSCFLYNSKLPTGRLLNLPPVFTLVSCSAYSSKLKMDGIYFSETSVDFQKTTPSYIPEYSIPYIIVFIFFISLRCVCPPMSRC